MYTKFGEFVKILRVKRHESQEEMASKLGITRSYLSHIENGNRSVPSVWLDKIVSIYELSDEEHKEMMQAVKESDPPSKCRYKLDVSGLGETKQKIAKKFSESFSEMSDEKANKILSILEEENYV